MTRHHGPDLVEKVRSSQDIVSLISEATPLKKSGRKYRGLCPFHNEKTPSFYVDESKQLFYCFGCGTGGDLFKFVMLRESVEFPEALRFLARRAGISVPDAAGTGPRRSEREAHTNACAAAAELYQRILRERPEGAPGRAYLERRGVGEEAQKELGLGFAPDRWDTASNDLQARGCRPELLQAAGILTRSEKADRWYDRFRNRIIFPITNLSGDVIAFGGREVGEGTPKYLNSPETLLYNKRENLFGLYHSRHAIKDAGIVVVVEGYLDYVSLWEAGIRNCVATLGTSFTDEQISLIRRFTEQVVVNYDSDPAGESATRRSLERLLARGISVRVLQLPDGRDPDDFVRESTPENYRALLASAPSCFDFLVDSATRGKDLADPSTLAAAAREILPVLAQVPSRIERSRYVGLLAGRLGIEDQLLLGEMRDAMASGALREGSRGDPAQRGAVARDPGKPMKEAEAGLVRALVENAEARLALLGEILPDDVAGSEVAVIIAHIGELAREGRDVTWATITDGLDERPREVLTRIAMRGEPAPGEDEARHCLDTLRKARLVRERSGIQREMELAANQGRLDELMRRKIELSRRIDEMS